MSASDQSSRTAIVIGASGGLGKALVQALCYRPDFQTVIALSRRHPGDGPGLCWYEADGTDPTQLAEAARHVQAKHGRVHLLINCIGTLHGGRADPAFTPEKALNALRLENLQHAIAVNAFAPLAALQAFAPLLRHADGAVAATLSAMVGSIEDNALGGWYSYRMSKAALNMGLRNAAIEFARVRNGPVVVAIHPGTTLTRLSEPFLRRSMHRTPEESASHILNVIDRLSAEDSGRFLNWDGSELPW